MTVAAPDLDPGSAHTDASVLGTSVLSTGAGDDGPEVVALWNLSAVSVATGAWVVDADTAFGDADAARRLLVCLDGRAVTGADLPSVTATLQRLIAAAGVTADDGWWEPRTVDVLAAYTEVLARRAAFEAVVESRRPTTKTIAPLEWSRDLAAEATPTTFDDLRALSSFGVAPGSAAVSEALTVSRVLRWVAGVWAETEQPKGRRTYLREEFGDPEPLPPTWRAATRTAGATRLAL